jgi:hypothetical protein
VGVGIACVAVSAAVVQTAAGLVSSDASAPTLTITAPVGGSTVSGTVPVSATSSDDAGVAGVQFKVDGSNIGVEDTSSPYSVNWNSTTVVNGTHTISAVTRDAAGNTATVNIGVTVSNAAPPPPPPSSVSMKKVFEGSDTDRKVHYFAITSAVPAGHTLVLTHASTVDDVDGSGGIVTPNGVSDARGNAWLQDAVSHPGTSFTTVEAWSAYVSTPLQAGDAIQVNGYPRGLSDEIAIFDVSGLAGPSQASRLDQRAAAAAYAQTQSTPFVTTAKAHELLLGVHGQSHAAAPWWTPEAQTPPWVKYTDRFDGTVGAGIAVTMREVTAVGSYRSRGTDSSSQTQNNLIVTYRAAS